MPTLKPYLYFGSDLPFLTYFLSLFCAQWPCLGQWNSFLWEDLCREHIWLRSPNECPLFIFHFLTYPALPLRVLCYPYKSEQPPLTFTQSISISVHLFPITSGIMKSHYLFTYLSLVLPHKLWIPWELRLYFFITVVFHA